MIKKVLFIFLLSLIGTTAIAQDRPALLNKFSKEIERNSAESTVEENMNLILNTVTNEKEKSAKKKASKYVKKLKEELYLLESTLQYNNYALLNELITNGYFKKITLNETPINAGDIINLHIESTTAIGLEDMLYNYPSIKEKHKLSIIENIKKAKAKNLFTKYAENEQLYAKYLLNLIDDLLDDNKKTLECKFKNYIELEASYQLDTLQKTIQLRQNFIIFCWKRIE